MQFNDYGLNHTDKNRARRYAAEGVDPQRIAAALKCSPHIVRNYLATLGDQESVDTAAHPPHTDGYGPLPGNPEWDLLSGPAKSGLTRKRQNAERRNGT